MAIHKTGSMMSETDRKAVKEAILQLDERIKDSPENARRFLEKVYAPADTGDAKQASSVKKDVGSTTSA